MCCLRQQCQFLTSAVFVKRHCIKNELIKTKAIVISLTNSIAKVKIGNQFTNEFRIVSGVKQGDPLSATLFSIVTDNVLKQLNLKGNISTRIKLCSAHADDLLLTTRTMYAVEDTFQKLKEISIQVGLTINEHKTKYLRCTKTQHKMDGIDSTQTQLEQVKSFIYLGSIVNGNNSIEEEIK